MAITTLPLPVIEGDEPVLESSDPRSGEVIGRVPEMGSARVAQAVEAARGAQPAWAARSFAQRAAHLRTVRDVMLDRAEDLIEVITAETGKLGVEAVLTELMATCEMLDFYAKKGERFLRPERVSPGTMGHKRAEIRYEPLGVVGVISPWNYPFTLAMTPLLTALFAGNTAVLKPSEVTPLVGVAIGDLFRSAGDLTGSHHDIVQVVTGGGATGDALVRSGVQKVCFTGSATTGRKVMAAAASTLTPVLLELGGKDPMVVCADADLDRAASGAVWGAFQNSGQTCMSVERVYVEDAVYEEFVDKVVARARSVRQGDGDGDDIGSMTFGPQIEIVERHIEDARAKGARALTGGRRVPGRAGLWYEPTVLVDVDHSMSVMRDETFGPVLPIMRVRDADEAMRLANDTPYGLNSSVWTTDAEMGSDLADRMEAGNVCVNDCIISYAVPGLPFGGVKESGIGRVHGAVGLRDFCATKSVLVDRPGLKREPHWFPTPRWLRSAGLRMLRLRYRRGAANKLRGLLGR